MSKRNIGQEILDGIREVKAYKAGAKVLRVHTLKEPAPPKIIRAKLKVIAIGFCRHDGRKFAYYSRLGTGQAQAKRSRCCPFENCRAKARSVYAIRISKRVVIRNAGLDEKSYLKWGLKNTKDILSWDSRFEILKIYYYFRHKDIKLKTRMIGFISDWMKTQYMICLRIQG